MMNIIGLDSFFLACSYINLLLFIIFFSKPLLILFSFYVDYSFQLISLLLYHILFSFTLKLFYVHFSILLTFLLLSFILQHPFSFHSPPVLFSLLLILFLLMVNYIGKTDSLLVPTFKISFIFLLHMFSCLLHSLNLITLLSRINYDFQDLLFVSYK